MQGAHITNPLAISTLEDASNFQTVKSSSVHKVSASKKSQSNCLRDVYPELVRTWHPKNSKSTKEVEASSKLVYWWKCPKGPDHEWPETIVARSLKGAHWCPQCLNLQVSKTNSLVGVAPHVAAQWHPLKNSRVEVLPDSILASSNASIWWQCPVAEDHIWQASVSSRVESFKEQNDHILSQQLTLPNNTEESSETISSSSLLAGKIQVRDCPCCLGLKVSKTNCLATLKPEVAELWIPKRNIMHGKHLQAKDVLANAKGSCWLKCHPSKQGHAIKFNSLFSVCVQQPSDSVPGHVSPFICKKCAEGAARYVMERITSKVYQQIVELEERSNSTPPLPPGFSLIRQDNQSTPKPPPMNENISINKETRSEIKVVKKATKSSTCSVS